MNTWEVTIRKIMKMTYIILLTSLCKLAVFINLNWLKLCNNIRVKKVIIINILNNFKKFFKY